MRGNVMDMAIGIILGAAFGKIVTSFVKDVMLPPIGMMMGGVNFENLFHPLGDETFATLAEAQKAGAATINYGVFFNAILDFLIVAFVIFLVIQQMNKLKRKEEAPPPAPTTKDCPQCLSAIPIKASRCAHCTAPLEA